MTLYIFSFWEAVLIVKWPWQLFPIQESFCPSSSLQQGFALFTFFCPSLQTSFSMAFYERNLANEERFFCLPSYYAICFPFFLSSLLPMLFPFSIVLTSFFFSIVDISDLFPILYTDEQRNFGLHISYLPLFSCWCASGNFLSNRILSWCMPTLWCNCHTFRYCPIFPFSSPSPHSLTFLKICNTESIT